MRKKIMVITNELIFQLFFFTFPNAGLFFGRGCVVILMCVINIARAKS